jgi:ferredoxin
METTRPPKYTLVPGNFRLLKRESGTLSCYHGRDKTQSMKITVDFDSCQSNALCMSAAPEVFEVRDDGFLYILIDEPGEELRAKVEEGARLCPTQAITVD